MKIKVNETCNVRTREGDAPHPANPRVSVDVTAPQFRQSFTPEQAYSIGMDLTEAGARAMKERERITGSMDANEPERAPRQLSADATNLLLEAQYELERLRERGWTQKDFARALGQELRLTLQPQGNACLCGAPIPDDRHTCGDCIASDPTDALEAATQAQTDYYNAVRRLEDIADITLDDVPDLATFTVEALREQFANAPEEATQ